MHGYPRCTGRTCAAPMTPCSFTWDARAAGTPATTLSAVAGVNLLASSSRCSRTRRPRHAPPVTRLPLSLLLCQEIDLERSGRGGLEQVPDAAGEVALEAADGLGAGLALGALARDVGLRLGVAAQACDGDAVDGGVDLAVAAAVEAVALGVGLTDPG